MPNNCNFNISDFLLGHHCDTTLLERTMRNFSCNLGLCKGKHKTFKNRSGYTQHKNSAHPPSTRSHIPVHPSRIPDNFVEPDITFNYDTGDDNMASGREQGAQIKRHPILNGVFHGFVY